MVKQSLGMVQSWSTCEPRGSGLGVKCSRLCHPKTRARDTLCHPAGTSWLSLSAVMQVVMDIWWNIVKEVKTTLCFPCRVLQQELCSSAVTPPQHLSWAAGGHSWSAALNVSVLLLCCCCLSDCMCLWAQIRCEEWAHVWPTSQRLWTSKLGLLLWCDLTCALGEIVQPRAVPHFMFCKMVHNLTSQGFYK